MKPTPEFETAVNSFFEGCKAIMEENYNNNFNGKPYPEELRETLVMSFGSRYARIDRARKSDLRPNSIHVFVDIKNGDVLKAASYKAPAKHARGNIFNADNGLGCMSAYGAAYLR